MPAEDDIVQRIILEGDKTVIAQFQTIGNAGAASFAKVNAAAQATAGTFAKSGSAFTDILNGLRGTKDASQEAAAGMEEAARSGVTLAQALRLLGKATGVRELSRLSASTRALSKLFEVALPAIFIAGLEKLGAAGAKAAQDFDNLAASLKLTNPEMQALQAVGNASGLSFDELSSSMKAVDKLTKDTAEGADKNTKEFRRLKDELEDTHLKADDLAISFKKVAKSGRDSAQAFAKQVRDIGQATIDSNKDFETSLRKIQEQRNDLLNGSPSPEVQRQRQLRDLNEQEQALRDKQTADIQKAMEDQTKATQDYLDKAEERRLELRKLNIEEEANIKKENDIRRQMTEARIEAERNATALDKLGISATGADGKLKKAPQTLLDIAAALSKVKDPAEQLKIEQDLINAGIDRKLIPALRRGVDGFQQLQKASANINPGFGKEQIKSADDFAIAIGQVGDATSALFKQMGIAVAPEFVGLFNKLRDLLVDIRPGLVDFAKSLAKVLTPALELIVDIIKNGVVPVFKFIFGLFEGLANQINKTFGTKITGMDIFVGALLSLGAALRGGLLLIQAVIIGVGLLVKAFSGVDFSPIGKSVKSAFTSVQEAAKAGVDGVKAVWNTVITFFTTLWTNLTTGAAFIWNAIKSLANDAATAVTDAWNAVLQFFTDLWTSLTAGAQGLWDTLVAGATTAWNFIKDLWNGGVAFFAAIWTTITGFAQKGWTFVSDQAQIAVDFIGGIFTGLKDKIIGIWTSIKEAILGVWNSVKDKIGALAGVFGGGSSTPAQQVSGLAGGGKINGPGTGTSDSILARLSNGEWVMKAKAVKKYGTNFMAAINSMRFDPQGFNVGGLVSFNAPQPALRFAEGGPVSGGRNNVLNLTVGGETFMGLRADDKTMDGLTRFATNRQIRSAGRKPTWKS